MRLGQTSFIHFVSKIFAAILGFVATLAIARLLGADVLGTYSFALAVVSWLGLVGTMGINSAITKWVSEQVNPSAYALAGAIIQASLFIILVIGVYLSRELIESYIGFPAAGYLVAMLAVLLGYNLLSALLSGQHLVHISGLLATAKTGARASFQIGAIFLGFGLAGLFSGYVVGYLIIIALGTVIVVKNFENIITPELIHFKKILSFAKYSWIGSLRSNAFNWVDITVLGFFVNTSLIGFYAAAWNIAQFLIIFGSSISQTLFPEMSKLSAAGDPDGVADLLDIGLTYAGLLMIPGLIGGSIMAERILRIYGPSFVKADIILSILIVATLVQAYQKQFTTTLNAIDRPDLSFQVNAIFISSNVVLNLALIYLYGWVGAAVATTLSVGISLVIAYYHLSSIVSFSIPVSQISMQWIAGVIMGGLVFGGLWLNARYLHLGHNVALVLVLVALGAAVYFAILFAISARFRLTVTDNVPGLSR